MHRHTPSRHLSNRERQARRPLVDNSTHLHCTHRDADAAATLTCQWRPCRRGTEATVEELGCEGHHDCDHSHQEVILRDARSDDQTALQSFDLGSDRSPWLDEVAEIVLGLIAWRDDAEQTPLDRRVVVADEDGDIVAVAAHERIEHEGLGPLAEHRYLMVVAVRADRQRSGVARVLSESLISEMQRDGVRTVGWLVHPSNLGSIAFSGSVFAEADETYPSDDRPYARFTLGL